MLSIQKFYQLSDNIQQEVLDFVYYIVEKNGIKLEETDMDISLPLQ